MSVLKIAAIAVVGIILALILKNAKSNLHIMVVLAVSVIILYFITIRLTSVVDQLKQLSSFISVNSQYIAILIKVIGITYITQFASDICRDNGFNAIAGQIEIFCKITIAAISMPVVLLLLETVKKCID